MFVHLISQLPNLRAIAFGIGPNYYYAKYDEGTQRQLVTYLGKTCPTLTKVVISLINVWRNDWIWTRGGEVDRDAHEPRTATWICIVSGEPVNLEDLARICDVDHHHDGEEERSA